MPSLKKSKSKTPSVSEFLKKKYEYMYAYPGRIVAGSIFVLLHGHWITKEEFDTLVEEPSVPNFRASIENADGTKKWMQGN
jgi:hypothetical protein